MVERYNVRVTKDYLVFSAGHFITYNGDQCERLHGHNYRLGIELEGTLDENGYVFDFLALLELGRRLVGELDHRMLVPTGNAHLAITADDRRVRIVYREKEWEFPSEDCVILPIANTTTELLARHIAARVRDGLKVNHGFEPRIVRVELEENFGQWAECVLQFDA